MAVDLLQRDATADHDDLQAVDELGDLEGERVVVLVLGGELYLAGFLEDLLALRVDTRVERRHRAGTLRPGRRAVAEFREQAVEGLHGDSVSHPALIG